MKGLAICAMAALVTACATPTLTYNRIDPTLFGLPFFYWFQMAWVIVTSLVLAAIAYGTRTRDDV